MGIKPINVVITGFDKASGVFGVLSKRAETFGKKIEKIGSVSGRLGAGALGLGVGAAYFSGLTRVPAMMMEIEESTGRLAFTEKFTAEQSAKVGKAVRQMSRETLQGQVDLNSALDTIGDAGFNLEETLSILPKAAKQATAFGAPLSLTAGLAKNLGANFHIAAGEMGSAIDIVSELATANFGLEELEGALPRIGQATRALNLNGAGGLAQMAAGLEVIRGEMRNSGAAAKGFSKLLEGVMDPAMMEKFKKGPQVDMLRVLQEAGKRGENQFDAYLKKVKEITDSTDSALREAKLKDLFGDQDAAAVRALLDNMDKYTAAIDKYQKSGGRTEEGFARQLETTNGSWRQLQMTVLSMDFKPLARGITMVNDALKWMNQGNGENAELVIKGIMGAVALGGGMMGLRALSGTLKDISTVLSVISKGGPAAIAIIKALGLVQAVPTTLPAGSPVPVPSTVPGGAKGVMGKAGMAGGLASVAAFLGFGAYHLWKEGVAEGERQYAENQAGRSLKTVNTGFGGALPVWSNLEPMPKSNPDAIRAAASGGRSAPSRVEGEVVVKLEGFPRGTKVASHSDSLDFRPELGMSWQ